ncbi:MAG TPA: DNA-binding protein WhiA [Clostridiales bacterium]|nr:MAG: DNA-binding protein WhiA [Clostridiales bacterium GWD2_32_19]HCC08079.1 DNA-binding protein WhiA [Clostridiales bacterium]
MSFSQIVKEELERYTPQNKKSCMSEMLSILNNVGKVTTRDNGTQISVVTENVLICKRFYELVKSIYDESLEINIEKSKKNRKKNLYTAVLSDEKIVYDLVSKIADIKKSITDNRAYIRGSFLSVGSITDPEKEYHLEFVNTYMKNAEMIQSILKEYEISSKIINRKKDYIVYIKESEQIALLLNIIHAHNSLLKMEDIRIKKGVINNVNRAVNCETANLMKTVSASIKQANDIKKIMKSGQFSKLNDGLREVSHARLDNLSASLQELAEALDVSKSCINHRLRKLSEIAERI